MSRSLFVHKTTPLATLISRSMVAALAILMLGVFFHTYQVSSRLIIQEVIRTSNQNANLVQSFFDSRLTSLAIQQDSSAKSETLIRALQQQSSHEIEQYFLSLDRSDSLPMADFRFISSVTQPIWDDGYAPFYGLMEASFSDIIQHVGFSRHWQLLTLPSLLGPTSILVRRTEIVDTSSGESLGFLYSNLVLNNNFSLTDSLRQHSEIEQLVLTNQQHVLASTVTTQQSYQVEDVLREGNQDYDWYGQFIVSRIPLVIDGVATSLDLYVVQSNHSALTLRDSYFWATLMVVLAIITAFIGFRWWLQRKIEMEMKRLIDYSDQVVELRQGVRFTGLDILEFDHLGRALEMTFAQLVEQEKQFEDLFNFSLSPTLLWTAQGGLIRMNPSAETYFLAAHSQEQSLLSDLKPQLIIAVQQAAIGNRVDDFRTEFAGQTILWSLSPITIEQRIVSVITQGKDITSLVEAEKQSDLARQHAEQAAQLRGDFLAKMSHELRTPLNGILGASQLLQQTTLQQEQKELVHVLSSGGEHLLAVLNDILDFSKIEQGKFQFQKRPFLLADMVSAIYGIYHPLCREKGIELIVICDVEQDLFINSDQTRLNQILFNLLNNAVKFTAQGRIQLELVIRDPDSNHSELAVTLQDTGIGIASEDLERIFEPFTQVESTTTRQYGGSGLGLSIVKSLVDLLDGKISVRSSLGQGTCFHLCFPIELQKETLQQSPTQLSPDRYDLFKRSIKALIVEDNHTNAFILQAFCKKYQIEVDWVTDGLQAIESVKEHHYDMILMDNQLPYLGGVDATRIIRQEMQCVVPIFACTADGLEETQQAFIEAGANYVLIKPLKQETFYQALCFLAQQID